MKKLILLIIAFIAVSTFADTIVFRMKMKGRKFEKKNEGNQKVRNIREAYMVFDYNVTTFEITDVTFVEFYKENGRKLQQTYTFEGTAYTALVNSGRRSFMTLNSNTDTEKKFMVLIEPNRMMIRRQYSDYAIPASLQGTSMSEVTNSLGERTYEAASIKGKIHRRWTLNVAARDPNATDTGGTDTGGTDTGEEEGEFNSQDVASTVTAIQDQLQLIGYSMKEPEEDTEGGGTTALRK